MTAPVVGGEVAARGDGEEAAGIDGDGWLPATAWPAVQAAVSSIVEPAANAAAA